MALTSSTALGCAALLSVTSCASAATPSPEATTIVVEPPAAAHRADAEGPDATLDAVPFEVGQKWVGRYECAQGWTDLTLHVTEVEDLGIRADFDFFHGPSRARGRYEVMGRYDVDTRSLALVPVQWIDRPEHYGMVGLEGVVSDGGRVFRGSMNHDSCGAFVVRR